MAERDNKDFEQILKNARENLKKTHKANTKDDLPQPPTQEDLDNLAKESVEQKYSAQQLSPNNPFAADVKAEQAIIEKGFDNLAQERANTVDNFPSAPTPEEMKKMDAGFHNIQELTGTTEQNVANDIDQNQKGIDTMLALIEQAPTVSTGELSEKDLDTFLKINDRNNTQIKDAQDKGVSNDVLKPLQDIANNMKDSLTALITTEEPDTRQEQTQQIIQDVAGLKEAAQVQKETNTEIKSTLSEKDPEKRTRSLSSMGHKFDKSSPMQKVGMAVAFAVLAPLVPIAAVGAAIAGAAGVALVGAAKGIQALASGSKALFEKAGHSISTFTGQAVEKAKDAAAKLTDNLEKAGRAVKEGVQDAGQNIKKNVELAHNTAETKMVKHDLMGGKLDRLVKGAGQKGLEATQQQLNHKVTKGIEDLKNQGITDETIKDISDLAKTGNPDALESTLKIISTNDEGIHNTSLHNKLSEFAKNTTELNQVTTKLEKTYSEIADLKEQRQEIKGVPKLTSHKSLDESPQDKANQSLTSDTSKALDGKSLPKLFQEQAQSIGADLKESGMDSKISGTAEKAGGLASDIVQQQQSQTGKGR